MYAERRAVVMLGCLTLALATFIIGLMPSYLLSSAREKEVLERMQIMEHVGLRGDEEMLQAWLEITKQELQLLAPQLDTDNRPSQFIESVVAERVNGVSINSFSRVAAKNKVSLSISGVAVDIQALITFENHIQSSERFAVVSLPVSDLAQNRNIGFQIKFAPASPLSQEIP